MSAVTGDLIDRDVAQRHDELLREFAEGMAGMCVALHHIREEETYKAEGFTSFGAFLDRRGISRSNGRLYANLGPVLENLRRSGDHTVVSHPDLLKPIYKMLNPARQSDEVQAWAIKRMAQIVRVSAARAKRAMVPLDAKLIADVAEKNFNWLPASKRGKKDAPADDRDARIERLRQEVEAAFAVIATRGIGGADMQRILGNSDTLEDFGSAMQVMRDWQDSDE